MTYNQLGDQPIFSIDECQDLLTLTMVENPRGCSHQSRQFEYNRLVRRLEEMQGASLLIDFVHCEMLDSVTVGMLVQLTQHTRKYGGDVALCGINQDIAAVLQSLMLLQPDNKKAVWPSYPTRREAEAAVPWQQH